jgi:hypothetical protein
VDCRQDPTVVTCLDGAPPTRSPPPAKAGTDPSTGVFPAQVGDVWRAFAAGPEAWQDASVEPVELDGAARLLQRVVLLVALTWPGVLLVDAAALWDLRNLALLAALAVAIPVLVLLVPSTVVREASGGRPDLYLRLRVPFAGVALVAWSGLTVDGALLGLWPLGIAAGCDVCRTGWALGVDVRPLPWFRRLVLSPVHAGVILALAGVGLAAGTEAAGRLAWLYAALAAIALTATATAWALAARQRAIVRRQRQREEEIVVREHRSRGQWLHDDVCSELRLLRLRLEDGGLDPERLLPELDDLDHRLRLRQLEAFIGSGEVRLAEVVQPFLRRAQQLRVAIVETPTVEDAGRVVDAGTARAVQRAMSVLVANAVQAGSPTLAVRLAASTRQVVVEVEDEAGGFELDEVPVGGGIDGLRHELGAEALTGERTEKGTCVRAVVTVPGPCPRAGRSRDLGRRGQPARQEGAC